MAKEDWGSNIEHADTAVRFATDYVDDIRDPKAKEAIIQLTIAVKDLINTMDEIINEFK